MPHCPAWQKANVNVFVLLLAKHTRLPGSQVVSDAHAAHCTAVTRKIRDLPREVMIQSPQERFPIPQADPGMIHNNNTIPDKMFQATTRWPNQEYTIMGLCAVSDLSTRRHDETVLFCLLRVAR